MILVLLSLLLVSSQVCGATRTPTQTDTRTPSPTVTPTPSSTPTPTATASFVPTTTITLTKTFLQVTYVNPDVLVKGILQPVQIVCQANCSSNETVYLTSGSCAADDTVPTRTTSTTNATRLVEIDALNFTATFDTTELTPGVYVICWGRKNKETWVTEWVNTGIPVTVVNFTNVFPNVIPKARSQNLTITATPSGIVTTGTQIFLSSVGCPRYRNPVITAREETSPVSEFGGSFYTVSAQGLKESSQFDDIYAVCFRLNPTHGYIDSGLRVRVSPTFIVALNTSSVGRGFGQQVNFTCVGCTSSNFVYISSTGCLTTTASPAQTATSSPQATVAALGGGLFQSLVDTSGVNLGIYSFCWRASSTSAWRDTFLDLTVRATPVADIQPRVIAKAAGQTFNLTCSEGCNDGDLIYLTLGTCQRFVSAGAAGTDVAYLSGKRATVNAANLNPSPVYKVCFKAVSGDYTDTGLTVRVTGSNVIGVSRNSISKKFNQKISLDCCKSCDSSCNEGDYAYLTKLACSVDATDPVEPTTTTTLRVELDANNEVEFDISMLIIGTYRLCYRPRDGIYADTFIPIYIRGTTLVDVMPVNLPRVPSTILTFTCTETCLDDSMVYLTLDTCSNTSVPSPTSSNWTNLTGSAAPINTSGLIPGNNYKVCFQERGSFDALDSGLTIFVRNTPITASSPESISKSTDQTLMVTCVEGCADGDFIYITSATCGTTSTDPVPSSDTSPKAVLSSNTVKIDASGLLPSTGYKICYRAPSGMWADSNFTVIVRAGAISSIVPPAVVKAQLQQLTLTCGGTCMNGDLLFLTDSFCDPNVPFPSVTANNTAAITVTNLVATFDASPLNTGFYTVCYRPAAGTWINSTIWVQVTNTPVYAVTPTAIRKSLNQALLLSCTTGGCADGDYVYLSAPPCRGDAADPVGTAQTTTKIKIVSYTASVDATGLLATVGSQTYNLCYRAALSNWLDTGLDVIVRPTSLTIANPSRIIRRSQQTVRFNCTQDCTSDDRVQLSSTGCSSTSAALTPSSTVSAAINLTDAAATFDASQLTAPATYFVCYSLKGADFVDSTIEIRVWPTNVVEVTPTTLQKGNNQILSVTCTGCSTSDRVYLTSGSCAATAPAPSTTDSAAIALVSQFLNIDATNLEGVYKLCYSNGNAFADTTLTVTVVDNLPRPPPRTRTPTPIPEPVLECSEQNSNTQCIADIDDVIKGNVSEIPDGVYQSPTTSDVVVVVTVTVSTQVLNFRGAEGQLYNIRNFGCRKARLRSKRRNRLACSADNSPLPTLDGYPVSSYGSDALEVDREGVDSRNPNFIYSVTVDDCTTVGATWYFLKWSTCGLPILLKAEVTITACVATVNTTTTSTFIPVRGSSADVTLSPSVVTAGANSFTVSGAANGDSIGLTSGTSCTGVSQNTISGGRVSFTSLAAGTYRVCSKSAAAADIALTTQTITVNPVPSPSPVVVIPSPSPVVVDSSDDGLSGGAIAGIVVGSVVGGLLLLGALGFVVYKATAKPPAGKGADVEEVELEGSYSQGYSQGYPAAYPQSVYAPTPATTPSYVPYY